MPIEEGWRSGTTQHYPKTDIVVTVGRIVVVTIDSPRVVLIVVPRAAPQVRRSEPHSLTTAPASLATSPLRKVHSRFVI
jgi:hypothetical protein